MQGHKDTHEWPHVCELASSKKKVHIHMLYKVFI